LLPPERELWLQMSPQDRRHSLLVARRFQQLAGDAGREEVAAALLHDVGKFPSRLGTLARVVATVVGPRTSRFRQYHEHERLGAELLRAAGSAALTVDLVSGGGPAATVALLRAADDV
jgi:predicted HD phosphohydrolase